MSLKRTLLAATVISSVSGVAVSADAVAVPRTGTSVHWPVYRCRCRVKLVAERTPDQRHRHGVQRIAVNKRGLCHGSQRWLGDAERHPRRTRRRLPQQPVLVRTRFRLLGSRWWQRIQVWPDGQRAVRYDQLFGGLHWSEDTLLRAVCRRRRRLAVVATEGLHRLCKWWWPQRIFPQRRLQ